ncbi:MAG: hypothetical protein JWR09_2578 [Mucilaginibacter sp.]|nr:hypothetical protein [Mucilaginibacter sp.]
MENKQAIKGTITSLKCGKFTYEYFLSHFESTKVDAICFEIYDENEPAAKKYSFILEVMDNGTDLKVMDMFASDYKGRGISIPMILKSKELFGKRIISSSNKHKSRPGEMNWEEGIKKVWEPMVAQGLAAYNPIDDRYYVL